MGKEFLQGLRQVSRCSWHGFGPRLEEAVGREGASVCPPSPCPKSRHSQPRAGRKANPASAGRCHPPQPHGKAGGQSQLGTDLWSNTRWQQPTEAVQIPTRRTQTQPTARSQPHAFRAYASAKSKVLKSPGKAPQQVAGVVLGFWCAGQKVRAPALPEGQKDAELPGRHFLGVSNFLRARPEAPAGRAASPALPRDRYQCGAISITPAPTQGSAPSPKVLPGWL